MQRRFRFAHANRDIFCYDCRIGIETGGQFVWDNKRDNKVCVKCYEKLQEIVGSSEATETDKSTKQRVYWSPELLPTKPWEIGNYDINNWPEDIQQEYVDISKGHALYIQGLEAARKRLATGNLVNSI